MRSFSLLILTILLLSSCKTEEKTLDLLADAKRWRGESLASIENGNWKLDGEYQYFIYKPGIFTTFQNFELSAEMKTSQGASASFFFHTRKNDPEQGYKVIIDNSAVGDWDHLQKTGSLSYIRNINYNMVPDEEWFTLKIKVVENHISITVNGYPVVDYTEPSVPFRTPELSKRRLNAGTFAIESGFHNSHLEIRMLEVKTLQEWEKQPIKDESLTRHLTELHSRNFPVCDYHVHEKGDLTMPVLIERSAKLGINYGIAANCGLKFPIQNNEELAAYYESIKQLPIFKAMQAEGREWVEMFDPELVNKFDYAFTDAMTWTNRDGQRMRLWIPEETFVGDPEDFMEQLVAQIEKVVTEPIAIYVNPTYLPEELADRYDELWTDERIDRVVAALKANDVALEINSRLELPGSRVIAKAKEAGIKFAMGTNNTDSENLGQLEWSLKKVNEHLLQPTDMFLPGMK